MNIRGNKRDLYIAASLAVTVCLLLTMVCGQNHLWGDDFAAYILEGNAISSGTLQQQVQRNVMLHPSNFYSDDITQMDELVYVWGYPLLLSAVNRMVGERPLGEMLYFYKLLNCVAIGLMIGAAYLFYKRRLPSSVSVVLSILLANGFIEEVNCVGTDIVFTAFCVFSYLLYDIWKEKNDSPWIGMLLGGCLAYISCLRLNGVAIIVWFAAMCLAERFIPHCKSKWTCKTLIPFAAFGFLWLIGRLTMPVPSSNMKDVGLGNPIQMIPYYIVWFAKWIFCMIPNWNAACRGFFGALFVICGFWGLIQKDFLKQNFWYALLTTGTVVVACFLPYGQRIRYMLYILPLVMLFVGKGWCDLYAKLCSWMKKKTAFSAKTAGSLRIVLSILVVLICATTVSNLLLEYDRNIRNPTDTMEYAFTEESNEVFAYIQEYTQITDLIAYGKPRCMALVTGRQGFVPFLNGHDLLDADYVLRMKKPSIFNYNIPEEYMDSLSLVMENDSFELYQVIAKNTREDA